MNKLLDESLNNLRVILTVSQGQLPHILNVTIQNGKLVTIPVQTLIMPWHSLRAFLPKNHRENVEQRQWIKQIILKSVERIKMHYRLIYKMKSGSEEEREWALQAIDIIHRYNTFLKKIQRKPHKLLKKIAKVTYEFVDLAIYDDELKRVLFSLPSETTLVNRTEGYQEGVLEKIATDLTSGEYVEPTKIESDMFRMRGISQINDTRLQELLKQKPIAATMHPSKDAGAVITMMQKFTLLPGEEVIVEGAVERRESSQVPSVPISKSFRVSTIITQTGFPHPSQHTGWALTNALIPENPLRIDLLEHFGKLFESKRHISDELQPDGKLNARAKELLTKKKEFFKENQTHILGLHKRLIEAILRKKENEIIDSFFTFLEGHPSPFEYISQTIYQINKSFIERPFERLMNDWLYQAHPDLLHQTPKIRFQTCQIILAEKQNFVIEELTNQLNQPCKDTEKTTLSFALLLGKALGEASRSIFLQYFSEKIGFAPPLLKQFEQKLQTCAIQQLLAFNEELSGETIPNFENELLKDIELFEADAYDHALAPSQITDELEIYFNARYTYYTQYRKQ